MNLFDTISKYNEMMDKLGYSVGEEPGILLKNGDRVFGTDRKADLGNLRPEDLYDMTNTDILEKNVLQGLKHRNAMMISKPPYASICIAASHEIPAVLDDMAQIVGECVKVVQPGKTAAIRALRKADGVMIEGGSLLTTGRNLFEAFVAMTIVEKSAEVVLKAPVIGGAKKLGSRDAKRLRSYYQKVYSRSEKEHNDAVEW